MRKHAAFRPVKRPFIRTLAHRGTSDPSERSAFTRTLKTPSIRLDTTWEVDDVLDARDAHLRGTFDSSGLLSVWMQSSCSRLKVVLQKRTGVLSSVPFALEPGDKTPQAAQVAALVKERWLDILPESLRCDLQRQAIMMGAACARVSWHYDDGYLWPCLTKWPDDSFYYRDSDETWLARTKESGDVVITPGQGWLLWLPYGRLSFQLGAVASLGIECLLTTMSKSDWASFNASVAAIVKKVKVPRGASTTTKNAFYDQVEGIGRDNNTVLCEQNLDKSGFDFEYVDAGSSEVDTFERSMQSAEKTITIEILGQEKTTDDGGVGTYDAVQALQGVEDLIVAGDAEGLSTTLHKQLLRPLVAHNWGEADWAPWPRWQVRTPQNQPKEAT